MSKNSFLNKKGASSVLIILMMVVLVVFGLAALTTSMAAMRLGDKSTDWTSEYYLLLEEGEKFLYEIDGLLQTAESKSVSYIEERRYLDKDDPLFPREIQESIFKNYSFVIPPSARSDYLTSVMQAGFYAVAIEEITKAYPTAELYYSENYLRSIIEHEGFTGINLSYTVSEENTEFPKNLDIKIRLAAPVYKLSALGNLVSGVRINSSPKRYELLVFKEWQQYFDYSEKVEFDDIIEDPR